MNLLPLLEDNIPFLLSHLCRNPFHGLYGSFDRLHWAWANKGFSNADFQRGCLPLATVYLAPQSIYYQSPQIKEWIFCGLRFWKQMQHKNGSFDQWYPWEQSAGTTGFTLSSIVQVYRLLEGEMGESFKQELREAFTRAGDFLLKSPESHGFISNHQAGIALSLFLLEKVCGEVKYKERAQWILDQIFKHQSVEGWYREYLGPDPGYESLGISYLCGIHHLTGNGELLASLGRALDYYRHFIHPDGSVGGEYGSRNSELLFLDGFIYLQSYFDTAVEIVARLSANLSNHYLGVNNVDFNNFIPLLDSLAKAFHYWEEGDCIETIMGHEPIVEGALYFAHSGNLVYSNQNYYAVVGGAKGGVLKVFDWHHPKRVQNDTGYGGILKDGTHVTTMYWDDHREIIQEKNTITIHGVFAHYNRSVMTPFRFLLLHAFHLLVGRNLWLVNTIKRKLAAKLITQRTFTTIRFKRVIHFEAEGVRVEDDFDKSLFQEVRPLGKFNDVFMGSANYFIPADINPSIKGE